MIEDFDGLDVLDGTGQIIGTVERSYLDDQGAARLLEVKLEGLEDTHRLIPTDRAERTDGSITVPFSREVVVASPDASSAGDTLEGETLEGVRAYYAGGHGEPEGIAGVGDRPAAVPAEETRAGDETIGETARSAVEQARERNTHEEQSPGELDAGEPGQIRDLGDVIEVPIVEEELVKRPVVKEVLRIRKSSLTEQQRVSGEVRREDVEVEREGQT